MTFSQDNKTQVLQICHSYDAPFEMVADFYASLFPPEKFELTTLFLKGSPKQMMPNINKGRILFYDLSSSDLKGLKKKLTLRIEVEINTMNYDIIVAHRNKSIYLMCAACKNSTTTLIGVAHAYDVFKGLSRKWLAWRNRNRLHLLGVSEDIKNNILADTKAIGLTSVHNLPNCLDIEHFKNQLITREEARHKLNLKQQDYIIGTIGRLHPDKDHDCLIKAFKLALPKLPSNSKLLIMGNGHLEKELQQLALDLGISEYIIFTGKVPEGYRYLKAFDQFVLSSAIEPFGMVIIEAICADIPVISSRTGGGLEIVQNHDLLFPIGDHQACGTKMVQLALTSKNDLISLSVQNLAYTTDHFSQQAFFKRFWSFDFSVK